MNTDYTYCCGENCILRETCKRYQPNPKETLWWMPSAYSSISKECQNYEPNKLESYVNYTKL